MLNFSKLEFKKIFKGRYSSDFLAQLIVYGLQIVSGVFVGAYVARYLGPSQLGVMSLILTIGVIVGPLLDLGTRAILIKKFSQEKNNLNQIFWTIFWVKLVLSCCITTALFVTIQSGLIGGLAGEAGLLIAFGLGIILLDPFTQFQCVIIAAVKNKALMIGQIICLCFTALFRAGCVYYELSLEWFVGVNFLVALLSHVNVLLTSAYYKLIPRLAGFKFEALKILLGLRILQPAQIFSRRLIASVDTVFPRVASMKALIAAIAPWVFILPPSHNLLQLQWLLLILS